jgi:hypothetical protein
MAYWAAPAIPAVSEAISQPITDYIQQLAAAGEATAKRQYNCSGWVAHGYVDNLINTGIRWVLHCSALLSALHSTGLNCYWKQNCSLIRHNISHHISL